MDTAIARSYFGGGGATADPMDDSDAASVQPHSVRAERGVQDPAQGEPKLPQRVAREARHERYDRQRPSRAPEREYDERPGERAEVAGDRGDERESEAIGGQIFVPAARIDGEGENKRGGEAK